MSWDEFVAEWSRFFDGYDLRHASAPKRYFMRAIYRLTGVVTPKLSTTMLISAGCSVIVPLLAWPGGPWPAVAAVMVLLGLAADSTTDALAVRRGRVTRLESFYQTMVQRLAEVSWLLALLLLGALAAPVVICAGLVWAHEYVRARVGNTVMRRTGTSTVGDRPLRVWLVLTALVLAAAVASIDQDMAAGVVTLIVLCWVAFALIGIVQLVSIVRKVLA
jgi:hypothetical protein